MTVVLLTLLATSSIQLGFFLWKLSAIGQPQIGTAPVGKVVRALFTDWRWVSGLVASSLGWILFIQAASMGEISLVQPLMSAGDFLLVLLTVIFLKERLNKLEWVGVVITLLGAVTLSLDAEVSHTKHFEGTQLSWLLVGIVVSAASLLALHRLSQKLAKALGPEVLLAIVVGHCFGAGAILTKAMTVQFSQNGETLLTGASWLDLIDPLLLAMVAANVAGLVLLQAAFQRGRAAVIVPLQLATANGLTVFAGVLIYSERLSTIRGLGIVLILLGAVFLQLKPSRTQTPLNSV
jgi:uncharacterized membrane protein